LILEVWNGLGAETVGYRELIEIQDSIRREFGEGAVQSPAAIARVLADEGSDLRHPEVIEFDAHWRESQLKIAARDADVIEQAIAAKPLRLNDAESFIESLDKLRCQSEEAGDRAALQQAREVAIAARQLAEQLAKDRDLAKPLRIEQAEIAEWLGVWIKTPNLFATWLELRRRSHDFQQKFG
jgi:hypothetical protein